VGKLCVTFRPRGLAAILTNARRIDPIATGIVKSLSRPGANITGLTSQTAEISGKRLQLLEELAPGIRVVAVIVSPGYPFTTVALPQLRAAAGARNLRLEVCEARTRDELPRHPRSGEVGLPIGQAAAA
jgi:ABC-type uncharacterized transport system substrate-binding protein